jgi:hypothetical protein
VTIPTSITCMAPHASPPLDDLAHPLAPPLAVHPVAALAGRLGPPLAAGQLAGVDGGGARRQGAGGQAPRGRCSVRLVPYTPVVL